MKNIDKLIIKAKKVQKAQKGFMTSAIVHNQGDCWILYCSIWDGISGSGLKVIKSWHDSQQAAEAEAYRVSDEYPNEYQDVTIIINDIPRGEG